MNFLKTKHSTEFAVYLTDGYGYFPSETPKQSTLWVISPGGLPSHKFGSQSHGGCA